MAAASVVATHNAMGKVISASTRTFTSKAGKELAKTVINVNGNEIELDGLGDKTAMYPPGKEVQLGVAKVFGRWQAAGPSVTGLPMLPGAGAVGPAVAGGAGIVAGTRGAFPIAGNDYQISIIRQNSLTNAVNTVAAHVNSYGKEYELAAIVDLIIPLAYKYAAFSSGKLDTEAFQQIADKVLGVTKGE